MSLPATYKKLVATEHNTDFRAAVEIQEVPLTPPGPGQILIRNKYAGVNAADLMMAAGKYLLPTPVPCDMGVEGVGEVVAVADDVSAFKPGDFALVNALGSGYAEYVTANARYAVPLAAATPEIMSLSIGGLTASLGLSITGQMGTGETVLVTAAAGGTGQFAVQLAKLAGNHVIGTCGSAEKAAYLRSIGCDRVINYKEESLRDVLKAEYPKGVDLVFEGVGKEMFDVSVKALARFGRLVTIGFVSEYGEQPDMPNQVRLYYQMVAKNASVRGFNLNLWYGRPEMAEHMRKLVGLLQEGKLQPQIDPTAFTGVAGAIDAVEHLQSGRSKGKVVVRYE